MTKIEIYTSPFCDYCHRAKSLLSQKKAVFTEIDVTTSKTLMDEMVDRTGGLQTVPQIFIGEYHVAGCDDLFKLDAKGKLDSLLMIRIASR